jgi:SAM-dependent methyltransferase
VPDVGVRGFKAALAWLEYRCFFHPQYLAQVRRVLASTSSLPQRPRLLDVGCGRGLRLLAFRERGFEVRGLDFQPEVVAYVQKRFGFPVVCAPVEEMALHFPAGSFDIVTAFYVLEHVVDVRAVLAGCYEMLRPGGWLAAAVPLVDSLQARIFRGRWAQVTEAPRHVSLPTREGMRRVCAVAGFEEVTVRPDAVLGCAGIFGLSLFPQASTTSVYGAARLWAVASRLLAAACALAALPWCLFENQVAGRPALGLVFARKPGA